MDEKKLKYLGEIQRALGMIQGVSYMLSGDQASAVVDAIDIIDEALKEVLAND